MYPKSKYVTVKEAKFERPSAGKTYATEGDHTITLRLDSIVSIHVETIQYSHHVYCMITLSNGSRYKITETTADEVRLCLDIDNIYERLEE
jgi:hypothetical protein